MSSVSTVGLALSLVFGFLFLALIAELYYLLWWKKRILNRVDNVKDECNSPRRSGGDQLMYMSCWTKPSFLGSKAVEPQRLCSSARMADTQVYEPQSLSYHNQNKNIWFRQFAEDESDDDDEEDDDDDDDDESLPVPPRFLFTIIEETKEDLESEDGGGSLSRRNMSDLALTIETTPPYLTPVASPTAYFTPPLSPSYSNGYGFNPLFESSSDAEVRSIKSNSPPPKFKFLKEMLFRRQGSVHVHEIGEAEAEAEAEMGIVISSSDPLMFVKDDDQENGSFSTLAVAKNKGKKDIMISHHPVQFHGFSQCLLSSSTSSSQVLPVTASPSSTA